MTLALGIETSGNVGSVAVLRAEGGVPRVLTSERIAEGMRRGADLFPALERALAAAQVSPRDLDLVAVGTGPGSYTGLRVGITSARALAWATGAELLGVASCDAWADAAPRSETTLAVITDAHVRAVYLALYRRDDRDARWARFEGPEILEPGEAAERLPGDAVLVGDGAAAYPDRLGRFLRLAEPWRADAVDVARIALARHLGGERTPIDTVIPLYLRRTEAERKWERLHG